MGGRGGSGRSSAAIEIPAAQMSDQDKVFTAIRRSYGGPEASVSSLTDVRKELSAMGMDRGEQDAALLRLFRAKAINLFPASNQKVLSDEDRAARISVGNELKLHIMIQ